LLDQSEEKRTTGSLPLLPYHKHHSCAARSHLRGFYAWVCRTSITGLCGSDLPACTAAVYTLVTCARGAQFLFTLRSWFSGFSSAAHCLGCADVYGYTPPPRGFAVRAAVPLLVNCLPFTRLRVPFTYRCVRVASRLHMARLKTFNVRYAASRTRIARFRACVFAF